MKPIAHGENRNAGNMNTEVRVYLYRWPSALGAAE